MEVGDYVIYNQPPQLMKGGQFGDILVEVDHRLSGIVFEVEAVSKGQTILAATGKYEGVKIIRKINDDFQVVPEHFKHLMESSISFSDYYEQVE